MIFQTNDYRIAIKWLMKRHGFSKDSLAKAVTEIWHAQGQGSLHPVMLSNLLEGRAKMAMSPDMVHDIAFAMGVDPTPLVEVRIIDSRNYCIEAQTVGEALAFARIRKGLNHKGVAYLADMARNYYTYYENDKGKGGGATVLKKLAKALDLNFSELIELRDSVCRNANHKSD